MATLCHLCLKGGLDLPAIKKYHLIAHLHVISDWVHNPASLRSDTESVRSKFPFKKLTIYEPP